MGYEQAGKEQWHPELHSSPREQGRENQNPSDVSFFSLIREDLQTHEGDWLDAGFLALAAHRFGNWRMAWPRWIRPFGTILYRVWRRIVQWLFGIKLDYTVRVGRRVHIWHFGGMILGAESIGDDVHIRQNTTFGVRKRNEVGKPIIEDRVDIGCGSVIVGRIVIGHDSVIGANTVVLNHVPAHSVVVGNPGRVVKTLQDVDDRT